MMEEVGKWGRKALQHRAELASSARRQKRQGVRAPRPVVTLEERAPIRTMRADLSHAFLAWLNEEETQVLLLTGDIVCFAAPAEACHDVMAMLCGK